MIKSTTEKERGKKREEVEMGGVTKKCTGRAKGRRESVNTSKTKSGIGGKRKAGDGKDNRKKEWRKRGRRKKSGKEKRNKEGGRKKGGTKIGERVRKEEREN